MAAIRCQEVLALGEGSTGLSFLCYLTVLCLMVGGDVHLVLLDMERSMLTVFSTCTAYAWG